MTKEELKQYIDDNIYENPDGEITGENLNAVLKAIVDDGGTEVEANPTGEATETMQTIKIGETIYKAPQGPQGEPGEDGQDGQPGAPGPANTLTIGTVTDGEQASASITGDAPNQQLNLVLPKGEQGDPGQNAVNPFKGWYDAVVTGEAGSRVITSETQNLPSNPIVGDYANVKTYEISGEAPTQTETPVVKIYECTTAGSWSDSGRTADTSNVQTFASGEEVNEVIIANTLADDNEQNVLGTKLGGGIVSKLIDLSKVLCGKNTITRSSYVAGEIKSNGSIVSQNYCYVNIYTITDDIRNSNALYIQGYRRDNNTNGYIYAFYDSQDVFIEGWHGESSVEQGRYFLPIEIPVNATQLKVSRYYNNVHTPVVIHSAYLVTYSQVDKFTTYDTKIVPPLERGRLYITGQPSESSTNGEGNGNFYIMNKRTMNFIKMPIGSYSMVFNCSIACFVRFFEYDKDFNFIEYKDVTYSTANSHYSYTKGMDCQYIKIMWSMTAQNDYTNNVPEFSWFLQAPFDSDWNTKNVRPIDSGYQHICPVVYPVDADASVGETNSVQDNPTRGYDDGIIALPPSYTNNGKPTRLIIYCHGAGVNYSSSNSRFPSDDLKPDYWLNEGYAVMDVDGECGATSSVQHNCAPESLQCYIEAYKFVVERYNIAKDGVFLGGRSMGGAMSMYIMESARIPVIANCPVVPVMNTLWWWSYCSADGREYLATKMGMQGTQPSWTSGRLTTSEWQYLQDNFDTLRKYSPLWNCIADLPVDKSVLFNEAFRVSGSTINVPEEVALFGTLHAKVKAPVKFFDNYSDPTVPYERNAMLMYKMLVNGGNIVECRMFDVSNDTDTSVTAHHFEMRADRLTTVTTPSGQVLENVPVVYIEMLRFWQRYE